MMVVGIRDLVVLGSDSLSLLGWKIRTHDFVDSFLFFLGLEQTASDLVVKHAILDVILALGGIVLETQIQVEKISKADLELSATSAT